MNRGELEWMIHELNDTSSVIRGYAQLALECEHPNWSKKYITSIIQQIDKLTALTTLISGLYLNGEDDKCGGACKSTTLNNLISRGKYH